MRRQHDIGEYSVLAYDSQPIMVTSVGGDETSHDTTTVNFQKINPDGSLGGAGYIHGYEVTSLLASGRLRYIDHAEVDIRVKLPADWAERNATIAAQVAQIRAQRAEKLGDDAPDIEHPSYATITLGRSQGGSGQLFGSPFKHHNTIHIEIRRATMHRSLSNDRAFGHGPLITEVAMSEAQFAHFITSVAVGEGTPCTLQYVGGERMPEPPAEKETEKFQDDAERSLKRAGKGIADAVEKVRAILAKPSVTKKDREEILAHLFEATRVYEDSLPFTVEQFNERMEKIVAAGKHEIDAYLGGVVRSLGLAAAMEKWSPIQLTDGKGK